METWESGDDQTFPWAYDGSEDWFVTDNNPYQGDFCMESGDIGDNQSTALTIALEFLGDGELSFARRVSTEDGWDYLRMYIDGSHGGRVESGEQDWAEEAFDLTAGFHTITWSYEKDNIISVAEPMPAGWTTSSCPHSASSTPPSPRADRQASCARESL